MAAQNPPGLDLAHLRDRLDAELPGLVSGPLRGEVIAGGRSNLTYLVTDDNDRWVVRRPPLGHVLPTAHDMSREHRVISALHATSVPVPRTLLFCPDEDVIGAPFYVMEYVTGTPYRSADELAALGPERTHAIGLALVDTLAELHAVDPAAVGLADFGRPEGYLQRQLRRWKKQLDASRSRELPGIDTLHDRLAAAVPESGPAAIVHGDYRLDNVLVDGRDRITAVLDWEMSTLGDPLTDVALLLAYAERGAVDLDIVSSAATAPGYPDAAEVVARYAERSGRDLRALDWYLGFAFFKLAVILEGIHFRFSQGKTVGEGFADIGRGVWPLIDHGNAVLDGTHRQQGR
ncbi:Predicted kinase, aminoglycoside phosphotransferase (APT) family [Amycolatopsis arida]|uniref:Predicted kinase, aminoglycoside phosphotransferase (APT) family n=1 Tax=Amycolatopsis arida TaxID=587909 RepID=A0A1I5YY26_9PSEU|nr:phosphotransferase family protein [Amycolatopsis arida]TDX89970.1 aminoglycoside phosphotransferase (APT) family kinase protein [Amycolatopsis arida]SFQ49136.1 Predicted kinase, aminoglycoside phosphotransferase (APT) family [Amycolatopsis arida]